MRARIQVAVFVVAAVAAVAWWGTTPVARGLPPMRWDLGPVSGFVENRGQWPADVAFAASAGLEWVAVRQGAITFGSGEAAVGLQASGGEPPAGMQPTGAVCNYLRGPASGHVRGAAVFAAVLQRGVAPGVDLAVRAASGAGAAFAYDLHVGPGAAVAAIEFAVAGAQTLRVDAETGELVIATAAGELRHSAPVAWLQGDAARRPVDCRFELRGGLRFGFVAADAAAGLCIDPDLRWATCVGGSAVDNGHAIAVAQNGDVFVAGTTQSTNLPAGALVFDPSYNGSTPVPSVVGDGYVARFAAGNGSLLWCTWLGGNENDRMVAATGVGNDVVVTGWTSSLDFPTTPGAFDTTHNGTGDGYTYLGGDVFVTRLAGNGQSLVWSSFLGGAMLEYPTSMAVAQDGEVAVSGHVHSLNFPTTQGAYSSTRRAFSDLFLTRFAADGGSLVASTYFGGADGEEYPHAMAIAPDGDMIVAGATDSSDLPVTAGAYDPTYNGGSVHLADGFVARFNRTATTLRWCTYLGTQSNEYPRGIAMHFDGSLSLIGTIDGPGLPTTPGVFGPAPFGGSDGFVWRLSGDGSTSVGATYVGGSAADSFERAVALGGGRIAVAGASASPNVPLSRGSARSTPLGQNDGWLVVLSSDLGSVDYGAVFGGPFGDFGTDVQRTPDFGLVLTGTLYSSAFAVTPGARPYAGGGDTFCVSVAGLPQGVTRHGAPSGPCARGARATVRGGPFLGEVAFEVAAGDVPPGSPALAAVSFALLGAPQALLGIDLWVDPGLMLATPAVVVDAQACAHLPLPIPSSPGFVGLPLAVQFLWIDGCAGVSLGASDAVLVVIQP